MHEVSKDDVVFGYIENPVYIRKHDNGCFVLCNKHDATGIVFNGTPYGLSIENMDGYENGGVVVKEINFGEVVLDKERVLDARVSAVTTSNANLEECIIEMAGIVYA